MLFRSPRGSNAFVRYIMDHTRIPVMGHAEGLCHTYVDASADIDMAVKVTVDAKTQALAVCNATETLLVHKDIAAAFLPPCADALKAKGVEIRGDERTQSIIDCLPATEQSDEEHYEATEQEQLHKDKGETDDSIPFRRWVGEHGIELWHKSR